MRFAFFWPSLRETIRMVSSGWQAACRQNTLLRNSNELTHSSVSSGGHPGNRDGTHLKPDNKSVALFPSVCLFGPPSCSALPQGGIVVKIDFTPPCAAVCRHQKGGHLILRARLQSYQCLLANHLCGFLDNDILLLATAPLVNRNNFCGHC